MIKPWKKSSEKVIHKNPFWTYKMDEFETANGVRGEYYYHKNANAVDVYAEREDGKFIMLREYRHLAGRVSLSQVQGGIDDGESPEEAAHREIEEEIGYQAKTLINIGHYFTAPAFSTEEVTVFLARDLTKTQKNLDAFEDTEEIIMTSKEIDEAIQSGEIWDSNVIAPWMLVKMWLEKE